MVHVVLLNQHTPQHQLRAIQAWTNNALTHSIAAVAVATTQHEERGVYDLLDAKHLLTPKLAYRNIDIQENMILLEDLKNTRGVLLMKKGRTLNEKDIHLIRSLGISHRIAVKN